MEQMDGKREKKRGLAGKREVRSLGKTGQDWVRYVRCLGNLPDKILALGASRLGNFNQGRVGLGRLAWAWLAGWQLVRPSAGRLAGVGDGEERVFQMAVFGRLPHWVKYSYVRRVCMYRTYLRCLGIVWFHVVTRACLLLTPLRFYAFTPLVSPHAADSKQS